MMSSSLARNAIRRKRLKHYNIGKEKLKLIAYADAISILHCLVYYDPQQAKGLTERSMVPLVRLDPGYVP